MCSKALALQNPGNASNNGAVTSAITGKYAQKQLSVATLLYLATLGGARVCALEDRIGSFAPGKAFDALIVSTHSKCGNPALWGSDLTDALLGGISGEKREEKKLKSMLERFLFCGDDRNVRKVYVEGKVVGGAA
jgi:guanine deaminase